LKKYGDANHGMTRKKIEEEINNLMKNNEQKKRLNG
jgi:hypothetical protein